MCETETPAPPRGRRRPAARLGTGRRRWPWMAALLASAALAGVPARADEVWLRNGDRLTGKIEGMSDGKLVLAAPWGEKVTIRWEEVATLSTEAALPVVLADGTVLNGRVAKEGVGLVRIAPADVLDAPRIRLGRVTAINPPPAKPVRYSGSVRLGATITSGNTRQTNASGSAEFTARAKRLRLNLAGASNYAKDRAEDELIARNTSASTKLDFFLNDAFLFTQASFLNDRFRDLDLRATFGGGVGYQWVESADLELFTEAGISYVSDDRRDGEDTRSVSGRLAWEVKWKIVPEQVAFFHRAELFVGLEELDDWFVNTNTGLRFTVWQGFFASTEVEFRYDNEPSAGFEREDVSYILGLGYSFTM
ncbi:MAG: hypothetical protein KatS3mg102_2549 [Planctomycetota bacterium]|nr:MAG: hypothetical protein KatS3mg102_2549 [Planctomycetota bacterium]